MRRLCKYSGQLNKYGQKRNFLPFTSTVVIPAVLSVVHHFVSILQNIRVFKSKLPAEDFSYEDEIQDALLGNIPVWIRTYFHNVGLCSIVNNVVGICAIKHEEISVDWKTRILPKIPDEFSLFQHCRLSMSSSSKSTSYNWIKGLTFFATLAIISGVTAHPIIEISAVNATPKRAVITPLISGVVLHIFAWWQTQR